MDTLLKFKHKLRLSDAAKYLSSALGIEQTTDDVEDYLKQEKIVPLVKLLESDQFINDDTNEVEYLSGYFELTDYRYIDWEDISYQLYHSCVYLRELNGSCDEYKAEWEKLNKPRTLRTMWRANGTGHKIYSPKYSLFIEKFQIFIETDELDSFVEEYFKAKSIDNYNKSQNIKNLTNYQSPEEEQNKLKNEIHEKAKAFIAEARSNKIPDKEIIDKILNHYRFKGSEAHDLIWPDKANDFTSAQKRKRLFISKNRKTRERPS